MDGRAWSEPVAAAEPEDAGEAMRTLAAPLAGHARYVRVTCVKDPTYPRQLLAELRILPAVASAALAARTTPFLVKRALDKAMLAAGVPRRARPCATS